jgi:drug/metabolite transporter (DMT)-like permease
MSDDLAAEAWLGAAAWLLATAAVATLAFVDQTTALQDLGATEVGPIVFVMPVVIPVLLAPLIVGESWGSTPFGGAALAISVAVVSAGAAALSSSRSLVGAEASVTDAQFSSERVASRS